MRRAHRRMVTWRASETDVSLDPFGPAQLGPLRLRNRFIKAATFEGMAEGNLVSDRLIDFHRVDGGRRPRHDDAGLRRRLRGRPGRARGDRRAPRGGSGAAQARRRGARRGRRHLRADRARGTRWRRAPGAAAWRPSRIFSAMALRFTTAVDERDIARISGDFARAARVLQDAGFDALELHLGHNYLLSAFLSPGAQPAQGPLRRRHREPRGVPATGRACGARGRRVRRWRCSRSSTWPTGTRAASGSTRASRPRGCSKPTARSTRSS